MEKQRGCFRERGTERKHTFDESDMLGKIIAGERSGGLVPC
jgi:hypothetical protein